MYHNIGLNLNLETASKDKRYLDNFTTDETASNYTNYTRRRSSFRRTFAVFLSTKSNQDDHHHK